MIEGKYELRLKCIICGSDKKDDGDEVKDDNKEEKEKTDDEKEKEEKEKKDEEEKHIAAWKELTENEYDEDVFYNSNVLQSFSYNITSANISTWKQVKEYEEKNNECNRKMNFINYYNDIKPRYDNLMLELTESKWFEKDKQWGAILKQARLIYDKKECRTKYIAQQSGGCYVDINEGDEIGLEHVLALLIYIHFPKVTNILKLSLVLSLYHHIIYIPYIYHIIMYTKSCPLKRTYNTQN